MSQLILLTGISLHLKCTIIQHGNVMKTMDMKSITQITVLGLSFNLTLQYKLIKQVLLIPAQLLKLPIIITPEYKLQLSQIPEFKHQMQVEQQ